MKSYKLWYLLLSFLSSSYQTYIPYLYINFQNLLNILMKNLRLFKTVNVSSYVDKYIYHTVLYNVYKSL